MLSLEQVYPDTHGKSPNPRPPHLPQAATAALSLEEEDAAGFATPATEDSAGCDAAATAAVGAPGTHCQ